MELEPIHKISVSRQAIRSIATPLAALLLCASSTAVFANRPAMEDSGAVSSQPVYQQQQATDDHRPSAAAEPEAPSAVELMMQQQSQQQYTGDVVQLPAKEMQPGETIKIQLLDYPRRGMTMDRVQNEYGQPIAISDSVGKPPITRWTYNDRIVFFEYSSVLHVVPR
jgi:hypothetical protein